MISKDYFKTLAAQHNFILTDKQLDLFDMYSEQLIEWNKKINLTAITEPDKIAEKHFLDSLFLLNHLSEPYTAPACGSGSIKMIDVGSGAGFPSVPCKVVCPEINLTLLDSLNKRIMFLRELSKSLRQENQIVHGRAEDFGKELSYREQFDVATARAVAHLRELSEYCLPFVKVGGSFIALKGPGADRELEEAKTAIELLGAKVSEINEYILSDGSKRVTVCIKKISQTPTKYPRNAAKIKKYPIK